MAFQVYITGSAFTILGDSDTIVQTIYDDDPTYLQAVAFDESSGKIATCTASTVRIYKPFGRSEDALKVRARRPFESPSRFPLHDFPHCVILRREQRLTIRFFASGAFSSRFQSPTLRVPPTASP